MHLIAGLLVTSKETLSRKAPVMHFSVGNDDLPHHWQVAKYSCHIFLSLDCNELMGSIAGMSRKALSSAVYGSSKRIPIIRACTTSE